jgi:hypothetical protein
MYEAWMTSKAQSRRGGGAIPSPKQRPAPRPVVKQAAEPQAAAPVEAAPPKPKRGRPVPVPQPVAEVHPAQDIPAGTLFSQLKGAYGMAMGMAGVVVIVGAFAIGRMYGPKTIQAAPVEPAAVQTAPAPAAPAAPEPQARPATPVQTQTKAAASSDPWSTLMDGKQASAR